MSDAPRDADEGGDTGHACSPSLDGGTPPVTGTCTAAGWCWLSPGLPASELLAVSGVCGDVWAVGYGGTVIHRGPNAWSPVSAPTTVNLETVVRVGVNDVWVGDDDGSLYHYDGAKWTSYANTLANASIYSLWGASSNDVWAAGSTGSQGVLMHWDGTSWSHDALEQETVQLFALSGTSSNDVWVAGDKLYHWTGAWSAVSGMPAACSFDSVFAEAPGSAWTVCATDVATLFHGSGSHWDAVDAGGGANGLGSAAPQALWGTASTDVWMLSVFPDTPFEAVLGHYDGQTWIISDAIPSVVDPQFGTSTGPLESFVVGAPGSILHTVDFHTSYEDPVLGIDVFAISGSSPTDLWLVGAEAPGLIKPVPGTNAFHYDGTSLTAYPIGDNAAVANAVYVSMVNPPLGDGGFVVPSGWAVGADALGHPSAWMWENGTKTWVESTGLPEVHAMLWGVAGGTDGLFAVGDGPSLYSYASGSWSAVPLALAKRDGGMPQQPGFLALAGNEVGWYCAVGTAGLVVQKPPASEWVELPAPTSDDLQAVALDPRTPANVWVVGTSSAGATELFVWQAQAAGWSQLAVPGEPMSGGGAPRLSIDATEEVWLLGVSGTLFQGITGDAGTWATIGPPTGVPTAALWVEYINNGDTVLLGGQDTIGVFTQ